MIHAQPGMHDSRDQRRNLNGPVLITSRFILHYCEPFRRVVNVCCVVYQGHDLFGYRDWGLDVDALPGIAATPGLSLCALLYALSQNERKRSE